MRFQRGTTGPRPREGPEAPSSSAWLGSSGGQLMSKLGSRANLPGSSQKDLNDQLTRGLERRAEVGGRITLDILLFNFVLTMCLHYVFDILRK